MSDFVAGLGVESVGAGTIVVLTVIAILQGWLVTGRAHMAQRDEYERRLAETRADRDVQIAHTLAATQARIAETLVTSDSRLMDAYGQRDDWREAFRASDARGDVLATQLGQLTDASRTTVAVLDAMTRATGIERRT